MMPRTRDDSLRWAAEGTTQFIEAIRALDRLGHDAPSLLPRWRRRHVVAHVAANADALINLVRWAKTGQVTPMYASLQERDAGIERGTSMSLTHLRTWVQNSAEALGAAWDGLDERQWSTDVVTAQGRTVPASEIPWLRAREVCVHLVDLDVGYGFADLPEDFLQALRADVVNKRGDVPDIVAPLPEQLAWLTGRPHDQADAPELSPWL